ncbi:MAG: translation initiation factor IF-2 subunit gamma [Nanoarchaeota archaeon]|nr:translation initiation factor IF-2 subunit gamma [Nanoarchaeota archaeon]
MVSKKSESDVAQNKADRHLPEMNIGIVGHVDHGKTTLTQALTGKFTDEHSEELKRGISIRLGYADMEIRKCPKCESIKAYTTMPKCLEHEVNTEYVRALSVIDCPGHETLMATVLTGASLMDGALLVIAANEQCPQPQTAEHLMVLNIAGIKNIVIVQNKVDLVDEAQMRKNYGQIKAFIKGSVAENAPIIPVSAQHQANIDVLLAAITDIIQPKPHDSNADPIMYIARSFDVNRPGTDISELVGGVVGGSLVRGNLKKGDKIEIRPGAKKESKWVPLKSTIVSINQGNASLDAGKPGGLLSVGTLLDPSLAKSDNLVGNVLGLEGKLPAVFNNLKLEMHTFERLVDAKQVKNEVKQNDALLMNVNTSRTIGICTKPGKVAEFLLKIPVCASIEDKVALSRQIESKWRLIGWGVIKQ